jgi:hypothetical protein
MNKVAIRFLLFFILLCTYQATLTKGESEKGNKRPSGSVIRMLEESKKFRRLAEELRERQEEEKKKQKTIISKAKKMFLLLIGIFISIKTR